MASAHVTVDSVNLTFLIDNTLEWFGKWPPGFAPELRVHLGHPATRIDEMTGVPFLDLDDYCCAAHGLAVLITTTKDNVTHQVLFDTGPESASIARNLASLKVSLANLETIVLSHWHRDHSGGILEVLKSTTKNAKPVVVDLHPSRPITRGFAPPPTFDRVAARLPEDPTFKEMEELGGRVDLRADPHTIADGTVFVSGEIPRVTEWEKGMPGHLRWVEKNYEGGEVVGEPREGGKWIQEPEIMDERYAAIDVVGKGLIILSSCSHAGICNVIQDAIKTFKRPIHMVLGGFHLGGPEVAHTIAPTVKFMAESMRPSPTYVLPMHCTGFDAKVALKEALGEGCVPAGAGMNVMVKGDPEGEKMMMVPTIV